MNLKKIVVSVATIICAGVFYEVDRILAYAFSSDYVAEEVSFFDNIFSVLLLVIGLGLLLHEVVPYVKNERIKKRKNKQ